MLIQIRSVRMITIVVLLKWGGQNQILKTFKKPHTHYLNSFSYFDSQHWSSALWGLWVEPAVYSWLFSEPGKSTNVALSKYFSEEKEHGRERRNTFFRRDGKGKMDDAVKLLQKWWENLRLLYWMAPGLFRKQYSPELQRELTWLTTGFRD